MKKPRQYEYFYKRHGVKPVTGWLSPDKYAKLKLMAKNSDRSLTRYITRLLERHIKDNETRLQP